jgi:hypothetical protein
VKEDNKKSNIRDELARAESAKASAQLLFKSGYIADAISRLYYWVFHNTKSLLLTQGIEPKSHEGTLALFSLHFVKTGLFEAADAHIFAKLMKYRQEADYNASYVFTERDFIEFQKNAEELGGKIRQYLREKGYA